MTPAITKVRLPVTGTSTSDYITNFKVYKLAPHLGPRRLENSRCIWEGLQVFLAEIPRGLGLFHPFLLRLAEIKTTPKKKKI